jgi:hypothetical protein
MVKYLPDKKKIENAVIAEGNKSLNWKLRND